MITLMTLKKTVRDFLVEDDPVEYRRVPTVMPIRREPLSAERLHIENKIREHEQEIARHAQQIRWLRMELES